MKAIGKKIWALVFIFTFTTMGCGSAELSEKSKEQIVSKINQTYPSIEENLSFYTKSEKDLFGYSTEGGVLEAYFNKKELQKMQITLYGEMGQMIEEYYFDDDELIYINTKASHYAAPFERVAMNDSESFYFDDNRLIKWIDKSGKDFPSFDFTFRDKQMEILKELDIFVAMAKVEGEALTDNYDNIFDWLAKNGKDLELGIVKGYVHFTDKSSVFFYTDNDCEEDCHFWGKVLVPVEGIYRLVDLPDFNQFGGEEIKNIRVSSVLFRQVDDDEENEIITFVEGGNGRRTFVTAIFDWQERENGFRELRDLENYIGDQCRSIACVERMIEEKIGE